MDQVIRCFRIGNLDAAGWQAARQLPLADFEDAVVAIVAQTTGSAYLVTRSTSDFVGAPVPAINPADF